MLIIIFAVVGKHGLTPSVLYCSAYSWGPGGWWDNLQTWHVPPGVWGQVSCSFIYDGLESKFTLLVSSKVVKWNKFSRMMHCMLPWIAICLWWEIRLVLFYTTIRWTVLSGLLWSEQVFGILLKDKARIRSVVIFCTVETKCSYDYCDVLQWADLWV